MIKASRNLSDEYWFQEGPGVRKSQFRSNGIKLLNVRNILKSNQINLSNTYNYLSVDEAENKYKHFLCDKGDLVIASSGIGYDDDGLLKTRGAIIEEEHLPLCMNTSTIRFKSKNNNEIDYLKYWLQSYEFRDQISRQVTGSAQKNFGPSHLKKIKITIPNLKKQKKIIKLFNTLEAISLKRYKINNLLDELIESIFIKKFGQLGNFKFKTKTLSFLSTNKGEYGSGQSAIEYNENLPRYIRITDINDDGSLKEKLVSPSGDKEDWNKYYLRNGDLLFARSGATVGKTYLHNCDKNYIYAGYLIKFELNQKIVLPEYVFAFTKTNFYKNWIENKKNVVAQPNINAKQFGELEIPVPPLKLQLNFVKIFNNINLQKLKFNNIIKQHKKLLNVLEIKMFS